MLPILTLSWVYIGSSYNWISNQETLYPEISRENFKSDFNPVILLANFLLVFQIMISDFFMNKMSLSHKTIENRVSSHIIIRLKFIIILIIITTVFTPSLVISSVICLSLGIIAIYLTWQHLPYNRTMDNILTISRLNVPVFCSIGYILATLT